MTYIQMHALIFPGTWGGIHGTPTIPQMWMASLLWAGPIAVVAPVTSTEIARAQKAEEILTQLTWPLDLSQDSLMMKLYNAIVSAGYTSTLTDSQMQTVVGGYLDSQVIV